jgi:hypothetical protein
VRRRIRRRTDVVGKAKRQLALIAASAGAEDDQAFVDDLSEWDAA